MQPDQAANTLRVALEHIETTGTVSGAALANLKRLVRDLVGKETQLDYVQHKVTLYALECLLQDCRDGPTSFREEAQDVVNRCPIRKRKGEAGHQSVEVIISEAISLLK